MENVTSLKIHRLKKSHIRNKSEIEEIIKTLLEFKKTLTKFNNYLTIKSYYRTTCELIEKFQFMQKVEQANYEKKLLEERIVYDE